MSEAVDEGSNVELTTGSREGGWTDGGTDDKGG